MNSKSISAIVLAFTMLVSSFGLCTNVYGAKDIKGVKDYRIHLKHSTLKKEKERGKQKATDSSPMIENSSKTKPYVVIFNDFLTDEMKLELEKEGAELVEYAPDNAFLCLINSNAVAKVRNLDFVADVIKFEKEYKIDPDLMKKTQSSDKDSEVKIRISTFGDLHQIEKELVKKGGSKLFCNNKEIIAKVKYNLIEDLLKYDAVKLIEEEYENQLHNDIATGIIGAETASVMGYEGEGQIVCVADSGLDNGKPGLINNTLHKDFSTRVIDILPKNTKNTDGADLIGHGTHVAGSVLGDGTMSEGKIKGTAPKAKLIMQSYGHDSDSLSFDTTLYNILDEAYDLGARIHTNSWGGNAKGKYTENCEDLDKFIWDNKDMTVLFSSGNGGRAGNCTVGSPGSAKNCITVGATVNYRPYLTNINDPDERAVFSSYGTVDGRIKPDVVAPGQSIASTKSSLLNGSDYPGNANYLYMDGTSMSTPITAGAVAVVREYIQKNYNISSPSAALIKAFVINGALSDGYTNEKGWGKVSLADTLMSTKVIDETTSLTVGQTKTYSSNCVVANGDKPLKITLVWTDYPGSSVYSKALVNDLDLKVISPSGNVTYYGNDFTKPYNSEFDRINNVENVVIQNPEIGTYRVEVTGYYIPNGPQPFAIVYSSDYLSTPKNMRANASLNSITANWDAVSGATSYEIEIDGADIQSVTETSFTHNNLNSNSEHKYRVRAVNPQKTGEWSNTLTVYTLLEKPILTGEVVNKALNISWNNIPDANYYEIYVNGGLSAVSNTNEFSYNISETNASYAITVKATAGFTTSEVSEKLVLTSLDGGISYKTPMLEARIDFGAVAASNGKIYVMGGKKGPFYINTVEEYDPETDTWNNQKAPMPSTRINFAAVEADNGKIYAIGGEGSGALDTVEEYDPITDKWTTKAKMNIARSKLGAVALGGKIYAIGGFNGFPINSIEVYDPVSNTWTIINAPMHTKRSDFGIGIVNGKIIVAGGDCASEKIKSVEEFDPLTNKWTVKHNMENWNSNFAMTEIDGKLYCSGGNNSDIIKEYNPKTDTWTDRGNLPEGINGHASVSQNGKVYILGGFTDSYSYTNKVVEYTPELGLWQKKSDMNDGKIYFACAELNGKMYTFGGSTGKGIEAWALDTVEEYDLEGNTWTQVASMGRPTVGAEAAVVNGKIYVFGGCDDIFTSEYYSTMKEYDPINKTWKTKKDMPDGRASHRAVVLDGYIYVIGGADYGDGRRVFKYDPINDSWSTMSSLLPIPLRNHSVAAVNGKIYAIGGSSGSKLLNTVYEYDPQKDIWTEKASLPGKILHAGCVSMNGKIYLKDSNSIYEYEPVKQSFVEIKNYSFRSLVNKAILFDNKMYTLGGLLFPNPITSEYYMDGVYCSDEMLPSITVGSQVIDIKSSAKDTPVAITKVPSEGIFKAEVSIKFDPSRITVSGVTPGKVIPEGYGLTYNIDSEQGIVSVQFTGDISAQKLIMENGDFANVQFDVLDSVSTTGQTNLTLIPDSCRLYRDLSFEYETKKLVNGNIDIFMYGDLNDDNKVNSTDKVYLERYILEIYNNLPDEYGTLSADLNGDGKINASDLTLINRYILGIITEFPVQQ